MTGEPWSPQAEAAWAEDCRRWRGRLLTGGRRHWCLDWDLLPVDDTCPEWPCSCAGIEEDQM